MALNIIKLNSTIVIILVALSVIEFLFVITALLFSPEDFIPALILK